MANSMNNYPMRIVHAAAAAALFLLVHGANAAPRAHRWTLANPDVPHDPVCEKLQKVINDYFRRYPAMPDACVDAALSGAFAMPDWQPLPEPSLEFIARIEKYLQVGHTSYFADEDRGRPIDDVYFYRAGRFNERKRQMFFWRGEMAEQFTSLAKVPGKIKTILQYRFPKSDGGCDGNPDQETLEALILMADDLSGPLRTENSFPSVKLSYARMRLYNGMPVLIRYRTVHRQYPNGFGPMCMFENSHR